MRAAPPIVCLWGFECSVGVRAHGLRAQVAQLRGERCAQRRQHLVEHPRLRRHEGKRARRLEQRAERTRRPRRAHDEPATERAAKGADCEAHAAAR